MATNVEVYVKDMDPREEARFLWVTRSAEDNPWEILKQELSRLVLLCEAKIVCSHPVRRLCSDHSRCGRPDPHQLRSANERINKPSDVLKVGDVVKVKITEIDFDKKRISLSIKALLNDEAEEAADAE